MQGQSEARPRATARPARASRILIASALVVGGAISLSALPADSARAAETDVVARDRYGRMSTAGWGTAPVGGRYTVSGSPRTYWTNGAGSMRLPRAGTSAEARLNSVSVRDVDVSFRVRTNKAATGTGPYAYAIVRSSSPGNEYRVRVRFARGGAAYVHAAAVMSGRETALGHEVRVRGLTVPPGRQIRLRARVTGAAPTTIRVRAWLAGTREPTAWHYAAKNSTAGLQRAGSVGLRTYLSSGSTNAPMVVTFDSLRVAAARSAPAPAPDPTPAPSADRTFYVSMTGSDGNAGTISAPWRTLQKAADRVQPGDRVYIRSGTYGAFSVRRSGAAGAPIVFSGYPGDAKRPRIDGRDSVPFVISLSGVHHVRLLDLEITGGRARGQTGGGIHVNRSSEIVVAGNVLHDNSAFGIQVYDSTTTTVRDNDIYGNGQGVDVRYGGAGVKILDNDIHDQDRMITNTPGGNDDTGAVAVGFVRSTGAVLASGNRLWRNRAVSYDYGHDGGAFEIYAASNVTMTGNVMWDNDTVFEAGTDATTSCDNNVFTRNVAYDDNPNTQSLGLILRCARNMLLAHNTFVNLDYWVYDINTYSATYSGKIDGLRIINNVARMSEGKIYGLGAGIPLSTMTIDHNLDYNPTGYVASVSGFGNATTTAKLTKWTGKQRHGVNASPSFADAARHDYRLTAGSPAIDRGRVVPVWSNGYDGAAPDMGRHER